MPSPILHVIILDKVVTEHDAAHLLGFQLLSKVAVVQLSYGICNRSHQVLVVQDGLERGNGLMKVKSVGSESR